MTIKELRLSRHLTQAQLAEMIGVDRSAVGKMENGRKGVSEQIAEKIWEIFGVEVSVEEKGPAKKNLHPKPEIYIQSPLGGNITPEEILAKLPEGVDAVYVRVDQNKLWWVRGVEYGDIDIW